MHEYLVAKMEGGSPVAFLAGAAYRQVQSVNTPIGARQFSDMSAASTYARFWSDQEPWAEICVLEVLAETDAPLWAGSVVMN